MKYFLLLMVLFSSHSFAYIAADESDPYSMRAQQKENEDRLSALESKTQSNELEQFEQELHDNAGDI